MNTRKEMLSDGSYLTFIDDLSNLIIGFTDTQGATLNLNSICATPYKRQSDVNEAHRVLGIEIEYIISKEDQVDYLSKKKKFNPKNHNYNIFIWVNKSSKKAKRISLLKLRKVKGGNYSFQE